MAERQRRRWVMNALIFRRWNIDDVSVLPWKPHRGSAWHHSLTVSDKVQTPKTMRSEVSQFLLLFLRCLNSGARFWTVT